MFPPLHLARINNIRWLLPVAILLIGTLAPLPSMGQCVFPSNAFTDGEEFSYIISYNWGPIWVDAGIVTFSTKLEQKNNRPVWHLTSTGRTYLSYDFLFKVRDTYETWLDTATLRTIEFRRYIYEGGYQLQNRSWFDYSRNQVFSNTKINDGPMKTDTVNMGTCTFDMLSAVYYVRALSTGSFHKQKSLPVRVAIDDSTYRIDVRWLGIEIVEHPNGERYTCNKFSATMVEGTIFTKDQEAFVWVSDDPKRIPVYVEAKILVGTVKAYLKEVKGVR